MSLKRKVRGMYLRGCNTKEIALKLNYSRQYIYNILRMEGLYNG
jgi:DNA-binding CsgD family transcriptional regulator